MKLCDRCGKEAFVYTMSMFNTEEICMPCKDRECDHPLYETARKAEAEAVLAGNLNFEGIGLPLDLKRSGQP